MRRFFPVLTRIVEPMRLLFLAFLASSIILHADSTDPLDLDIFFIWHRLEEATDRVLGAADKVSDLKRDLEKKKRIVARYKRLPPKAVIPGRMMDEAVLDVKVGEILIRHAEESLAEAKTDEEIWNVRFHKMNDPGYPAIEDKLYSLHADLWKSRARQLAIHLEEIKVRLEYEKALYKTLKELADTGHSTQTILRDQEFKVRDVESEHDLAKVRANHALATAGEARKKALQANLQGS